MLLHSKLIGSVVCYRNILTCPWDISKAPSSRSNSWSACSNLSLLRSPGFPGSSVIKKWKSVSYVQLFATPWTLYSPWNSPGQNTGVGSLSFLQGIFPTQGLNPGLPHYRHILYQLSHQGSPYISIVKTKPLSQVTNIFQLNIWQILSFSHYKILPAIDLGSIPGLGRSLEKGKVT